MNNRRIKLSVVAAAAATLAWVSPALAQFQVNTGNALDANNQAGTGGSNTPVPIYTVPQPLYNGNQVITGNVTQGRGFRGGLGYTDPNALRTNTAGLGMENFNRNSVGVPQSYQPTVPAYTAPRAYIGQTQAARAPQGFTLNNFSGAYVAQTPQRPTLSNSTQVNVPPADGLNPRDIGMVQPTRADTLVSGGPLYTNQPLYTPTGTDLAGPPGYGAFPRYRSADSLRLNDSALQRMRLELNQTLTPTGQQEQQSQQDGQDPLEQRAPEVAGLNAPALGAQPVGARPLTTPPVTGINNDPVASRLDAPFPGTDDGRGGGGGLLAPAARQSTQYAQLQQRLNQFQQRQQQQRAQAGALTGTDSASATGADRGAGQANTTGRDGADARRPGLLEGASKQRDGGDRRAPGAGRTPAAIAATGDRAPAQQFPPSVPRAVNPLDVRSLASGIQASGLRELMTDAERMTREGKFAAALERYAAAEAVAPNNPLVWLGRAHAQLGAGYYARAEADLRNALMTDRALLMGRYDLEYFLGESRLNAVGQDLKDIANAEKDDVRTPFLLAYIAYHTKNPERAAEYLDLAQTRAGAGDSFFQLVREHWDLPAAKRAEEPK